MGRKRRGGIQLNGPRIVVSARPRDVWRAFVWGTAFGGAGMLALALLAARG